MRDAEGCMGCRVAYAAVGRGRPLFPLSVGAERKRQRKAVGEAAQRERGRGAEGMGGGDRRLLKEPRHAIVPQYHRSLLACCASGDTGAQAHPDMHVRQARV